MITWFDVALRLVVAAIFLAGAHRSHTMWPALTATMFAFNAGMCFGNLRSMVRK